MSRRFQLLVGGLSAVLVLSPALFLDGANAGSVTPSAAPPPAKVWLPVQTVSADGADADSVAVAVAGDGTAMAVWVRDGWVQAARRPAGHAWRTPVDLGRGKDPQVVVDARGRFTALWARSRVPGNCGPGSIWSSRTVPGRGWVGPVRVARPTGGWLDGLSLTVNDSGRALAAWTWMCHDEFARVSGAARTATGRWRAPMRLTPAAAYVRLHDVGIARSGAAVLAFAVDDGPVKARLRTRAGSWGPVVRVSSRADAWSSHVAAGMDRAGNVVVVWDSFQYGLDRTRILAARHRAGGHWTAPVRLGVVPGEGSLHDVSTAPAGDTVVAWAYPNGRVRAVRGQAGGGWRGSVLVAPSGDSVVALDVAAGRRDSMVLLVRGAESWVEYGQAVHAVRFAAASGWRSPVTLADTGTLFDPAVAVTPGGDVMTAWARDDGGSSARIQARWFNAP